eukprot:362836-Chlamydomonas_euryale.AAC.7
MSACCTAASHLPLPVSPGQPHTPLARPLPLVSASPGQPHTPFARPLPLVSASPGQPHPRDLVLVRAPLLAPPHNLVELAVLAVKDPDLVLDLVPFLVSHLAVHLLRLLLVLAAQVAAQDVADGADVEVLLQMVECVLRDVRHAQVGVAVDLALLRNTCMHARSSVSASRALAAAGQRRTTVRDTGSGGRPRPCAQARVRGGEGIGVAVDLDRVDEHVCAPGRALGWRSTLTSC